MHRQFFVSVGVVLSLVMMTQGVSAQGTEPLQINETTLTHLYNRHLNEPNNRASLEQRITTERERIRKQIEDEYREQSLAATQEDDVSSDQLRDALESQRVIVTNTEQSLQTRRADLEQLNAEEDFYLEPETETGSTGLRLTTTHAELLAKRAILEERITVLESVLSLQQNKLGKLVYDQRIEQFGIFIDIGKYLLIIGGILLLERLFRATFISRITNHDRRYTVGKIFTAAVYVVIVAWLLSTFIAEQPNVLASLAIIGAGLVISLQDLVKDILGWVLILQNQLYAKGDRVIIHTTSGKYMGEVIDIGVFTTTLLEVGDEESDVQERTGRTLSIPNALVLINAVTNHNTTSDFVRGEMALTLTRDSDWRKAETIFLPILEEVTQPFLQQEQLQYGVRSRRFYIPHAISRPVIHIRITQEGIECTLRYTTPIGERRPVNTEITRRILSALETEDGIKLIGALS